MKWLEGSAIVACSVIYSPNCTRNNPFCLTLAICLLYFEQTDVYIIRSDEWQRQKRMVWFQQRQQLDSCLLGTRAAEHAAVIVERMASVATELACHFNGH